MRERPLIIGITGSIASGKSEVVKQLEASDYKVISTDKLGHEVLNSEEVVQILVEKFGTNIIDPTNNAIDRAKLSSLVFEDMSNLAFINSLSHPRIFKKMQEIINNSQEKYLFFEVPLLFEAELEKHFDFIVTVSSTPAKQLDRLMKRNNLSKEQASKKISSQLPNTIKESKSDFLISNNGDLQDLQLQTNFLIKALPAITTKNIISF